MPSRRTSRHLASAPAAVFAVLADPTRDHEWRFDVEESELIEGEAGEVGAVYRQASGTGKKREVTELTLTSVEPGRSVGFRTEAGPNLVIEGTYLVEADDAGSTVTLDVTVSPAGAWRLLSPFMGPMVGRINRRYLDGLATVVDGA